MSSNADLLKSLKIDRNAAAPPAPRNGLWIGLAVAGAVLLAAGGWFAFGRGKDLEVRTADVVAIGNGNASASVLDATGYVVARRMATVSAKVTGRVRDVRIEGFADLRPTASAGLAWRRRGDGLRTTIRAADAALYDAKDRGRDRLVIAEGEPLRIVSGTVG